MLDQLREIIVNYVDVDAASITPESRFMEDLGLSSFDFMTMLGELEETFDIEVDEAEASKIVTVQEALDYISQLQA
ncbi:MAG: acyl carrier protein [Lachnospiraceae bacterium]|nr:acyl carrier protein [Lachnospiraceae bacterium]